MLLPVIAKSFRRRAKRSPGPVRVCFLIDRLSRAGTETQLLALIQRLDRSRVEPSLALLDGEDEWSRSLEPVDCPVLRLGLHSLLSRSALSASMRLRQFWREQQVEVLQTYFLDSTYFGVPLARMCGIKKIIRVRNNLGYWLTDRHRRLGGWMGRIADITLTNSEDGKNAIVEAEGLRPEKIAVLENGVDIERFPPPSSRRPRSEMVSVGITANLRPVKNIDGLIRTAAMLGAKHPHLRFEVAGEGEQRPDLERLIAEHGLQESFHLLGEVSDVPAFLAKQDIAVLCSHSEGMSNALLEYMASGRAIVATDVGANSRLIHHEANGLIVPPKDDAALASAIAWQIEHPEAASKMAAAARIRAEERFSRKAMVKRFEDFYEGMIAIGSPLAASR
jgi:glycosyltransferase involved in cell wall biosynthesis